LNGDAMDGMTVAFHRRVDRRHAAMANRNDPTSSTAANMKVVHHPVLSNRMPPMEAPSVIASWMVATCNPPPASASSGMVRLSQVPHQTGAAVLNRPQPIRSMAVMVEDDPNAISPKAITAMIRGIAARMTNSRV